MPKIYKAIIEETLNKEFYIQVPDDVEDPDSYAYNKATNMYKNSEIVLSSDDFLEDSQTIMMVDNNGKETEWTNF